MRIPRHHTPGDLVSYKDKPGVVLEVTRHPGWMDRIEILFTDGHVDWVWAEDVSLKSHLR